jgi:hypothetical protein
MGANRGFSVKLKVCMNPAPAGGRMLPMSTSGRMKILAFHLSALKESRAGCPSFP